MPFARFTPIYGSVSLARYPLSDGIQAISSDPYTVDDPLWYALVNIAAWTLIFALICTLPVAPRQGPVEAGMGR